MQRWQRASGPREEQKKKHCAREMVSILLHATWNGINTSQHDAATDKRVAHCSTCTDREQISTSDNSSKSRDKPQGKMPKSAATYRKSAYKLWRENKDLKRQLQECQRIITLLQNSAQELNRVDTRRRIRQEALQESFEKMTKAFSEELKGVGINKVRRTARKSTAAKDKVPVLSSESSSEFESPESDVDSVDLAHKIAHEKASQQAEAAPETPTSPDA